MAHSSLLYARKLFPGLARRIQHALGIEVIGGPTTYHGDGLTTVHNADFLNDPRFLKAYAAAEKTGFANGNDVRWRAHVFCWAAQQGLALDGDFVESGVNLGGFSRAAIEFLDFGNQSRKFYLLDTFNGLVDELLTPQEKQNDVRSGGYDECYERARATFAPFKNVQLVRGAVPATLSQITSDKIAFVSIDMNCVQPEIAAAEFLWPRMSSGAIIVLDDYGWGLQHIEQKLAFDKFTGARGLSVLTMPTGQGIIVKP